MKKMSCAVCDSAEAKLIRTTFATKYNQVPIELENMEMYECGACGERFLTPEQAKIISVAVKNKVREQCGLLSPQEIVEIRKKLGLSQTDLENLLGLGPKVVTRWETGRVVQGKTADIVLRLLALSPQTVEELRRIRQTRTTARCHA